MRPVFILMYALSGKKTLMASDEEPVAMAFHKTSREASRSDPSEGREVVCGSKPGSVEVGGEGAGRLDVVVAIGAAVVEVLVEVLEVVEADRARLRVESELPHPPASNAAAATPANNLAVERRPGVSPPPTGRAA
jgi:hypothetical protein